MKENSILEVKNLSISFEKKAGKSIKSVCDLSFFLKKGQTLAIVGESGSGKSVTAKAVMGLLPSYPFCRINGEILYKGINLKTLPKKDITALRGRKISMIFQEPMAALNPLHCVGKQIAEVFYIHSKLTKKQSFNKVLDLLKKVGIKDPEKRYKSYPHELSGGQRQRVMIAMAIAENPDILIADEPTTALDVTVQQEILELLNKLKKELSMSMIFISHDLEIVKNIADMVIVMKNGKAVEEGSVGAVFGNPQHEYTKELMDNGNSFDFKSSVKDEKILEAKDLRVWFPLKKGLFKKTYDYVKAVDDINFYLKKGEVLGIVGESGSGKTTLGMSLLKLVHQAGRIYFNNSRIDNLTPLQLKPLRSDFQVVFQDPYGSLNPKMRVFDIIAEGLLIHRKNYNEEQIRNEIINVLEDVDIESDALNHYPHEFSGGQRQRIAIARAVVLKPKVILLDEPTSSLDRSVQFHVLKLLKDVQEKYSLSYIFISHDLKLVRKIADRTIVMKDGKIVEENKTENIFLDPGCDYTRKLIGASFY